MTEIKEKHKQKFKERGITLIALVITIIVLLILAGVAISALTGDSGILSNAEKAKADYKVAEEKELEMIQEWSDMINEKSGNESSEDSSGEGIGDNNNEEVTTISVKDLQINKNDSRALEITLPSSMDASEISYKSSDSTRVYVNDEGKVSGQEAGEATISIIYRGETVATCEVKVIGITIEGNDVELWEGETLQLSVTSTVEGNIIYTSSDETIFTVSNTGLIKAQSIGQAYLTVTCGEYQDVKNVEIYESSAGGGGEWR